MRSGLTVLACALCLSFPLTAFAQGECPPGSWFCDEEGAPAADDDGTEADSADAEPESAPAAKPKQAPPIVVYQPSGQPPDKVIVVEAPPPKPAKKRWRREWGFNLHLESVLMGDDDDGRRHPDSGMGGLGFGFRYRPIPHFAFEAGLDFLGGIDYVGNERSEQALLLNAIIFFNPRNKLQVYTIGGIGFSEARVRKEELDNNGNVINDWVEEYNYFGAQLGLGLEWRVGRKVALDFDVIGFIRGRTDEQARYEPEFVEAETGRTTNTSGGGLARLGITFYW